MSDYFYGWYFRCQGEDGTLAVIPAVHRADGKWSCSVQVITEQGSWNQDFPIRQFRINRRKRIMQIGENVFSRKGIRLMLERNDGESVGSRSFQNIKGILRFGPFTAPAYDIMGPFRFVPCMECVHAVYSMEHSVNGELEVNGQRLKFCGGQGYMEGDSGRSFPEKYVWTQHFLDNGSFMVAAASIPFLGLCFTGTTGILFKNGKEYRFATYLGASVRKMEAAELHIRQGKYALRVRLPESRGNVLNAPHNGKMSRRIREEIACRAEYILTRGERTLWREKTNCAAAEWETKEEGHEDISNNSGKNQRKILKRRHRGIQQTAEQVL